MSIWEIVAIFAAGVAAGTINTVVGSGTLITFPTLLAFGYPPVIANVSNTVGLVPGSVSGAIGYRRELTGQRKRVLALGSASLCGGTLGAILLLVLPASAFKAIVPFFIAVALILIVTQKQINRALGHRRRGEEQGVRARARSAGAFFTGIYGGYFGAAQEILMLSVLGLTIGMIASNDMNAVEVVTTGLTNLVAGIVFVIAAHVYLGMSAGLIAAEVDHRRRDRSALRPQAVAGGATGADRRRPGSRIAIVRLV